MSLPSQPSCDPYDLGDPPSREVPPPRVHTPQERCQVLDAIFARPDPDVRHSLHGLGADFLRQMGNETFIATRWFDGRYCLIHTQRLPRSPLVDRVVAHSKPPRPGSSIQTRFILSTDGNMESVQIDNTELSPAQMQAEHTTIALNEFLTRIAS